MLIKVKSLAKSVWANEGVRRVVHTFWQAAGGVLIAGLIAAHSSKDIYAAVVVAVAAGLAGVKSLLVSYVSK